MHRIIRLVGLALAALLFLPAAAAAAQTDERTPEPDQRATEQPGPERDVPERDVPERDVPERDVSERDVPERDVPESDVPERPVLERDVPEWDVRPAPASDLRPRPDPERDVTDRPVVQCKDLPDDRVTDRCPHIDLSDPAVVRHLIQRLINAHQWQLLFRLLHAIGVL